MEKIINVRFEGDNSLPDDKKLTFIQYINRVLAGQKDDVISSNGFVKIVSEKGIATLVTFISSNGNLNKIVNIKIAGSQLPL